MYDPYDDDEDLVRVVRSSGVAPFWRLLAICAMIGVLGIGCIALVLAVALIDQQNTLAPTAPPGVAGGNGMANNPFPPADEADDDAEEPGPHSYPTQQEGDRANLPIPGEPPVADDPAGKPHERFVKLAAEIWKGDPNDYSIRPLTVSPTGQTLVFADRVGMQVGNPGRPSTFHYVDDGGAPAMGGGVRGNIPGGMALGLGQRAASRLQAVGTPTWSNDGRLLFFAGSDGRIHEYNIDLKALRSLDVQGVAPTPYPPNAQKLVYVRSKPVVKTDLLGSPAAIDPTEVVLGNKEIGDDQPAVLIGASQSTWLEIAVSPDGKRLASVSDRGHEKGRFVPRYRVFLMEVPGGEPKPISPPATQVTHIQWTTDGTGLVYSRSISPPPPDHWEESAWVYGRMDLFSYDLRTQRETRLSRGGAFQFAGLARPDTLFFRADRDGAGGHFSRLMQIDRKAALEFAAAEPELVVRDAKSWSDLIDQVLREAKADADMEKDRLTPDLMARIAETYSRVYQERFKTPPPACLRDLDRQRWEVRILELSRAQRARLRLVLGAVEGEYLRQKHGAIWRLADDVPVRKQADSAEPRPESPFATVIDLLHGRLTGYADRENDEDDPDNLGMDLSFQVRNAAGRRLVLTNDAENANAAADAMADSDLEKGRVLLAQGKNADDLLKGLVTKYPENYFLALHVAKLLLENRRRESAKQILQPLWEPSVLDAQKHNLLGVAYLDDDPSMAVREFYVAYGRDLNYSTALLNLAQAYEANQRPADAEKCLRRFLRRFPGDAHAADARQRLAALEK